MDGARCEECGSWDKECLSDKPIQGCACSRCACAEVAALRAENEKLARDVLDVEGWKRLKAENARYRAALEWIRDRAGDVSDAALAAKNALEGK